MELVEFFGACIAATGSGALMNFVVKFLGRKYLPLMNKRAPRAAQTYKKFMQLIIKNHRFFGLATAVLVGAHFIAAYMVPITSVSGIVSLFLLFLVILLGGYGHYVSKDYKNAWLRVHRIAALLLIMSAMVHIFIKNLVEGSIY